MDAGAGQPLGRVLDIADDVDALAVESLDRRRGVRADDVQNEVGLALPENRHHLVDELEQRVLVRRARSGEEAAEEEQVLPLCKPGRLRGRLDPVREDEGRRLGSDLADELGLLGGDGEDDRRLLEGTQLDLARRRSPRR